MNVSSSAQWLAVSYYIKYCKNYMSKLNQNKALNKVFTNKVLTFLVKFLFRKMFFGVRDLAGPQRATRRFLWWNNAWITCMVWSELPSPGMGLYSQRVCPDSDKCNVWGEFEGGTHYTICTRRYIWSFHKNHYKPLTTRTKRIQSASSEPRTYILRN